MDKNNNHHISQFSEYFTRLNSISDFSQWFFYSGMLFGHTEKWWGKGGSRPAPHEGLDICYYINNQGDLCQLGHEAIVPVMYDGVVVHISDDDFLGKSIFVRHEVYGSDSKILHSVYAHLTPLNEIRINSNLRAGESLATIADITAKKLLLPGHLHLTMVFLPDDYPNELLKWEILATSPQVRLVDPLTYLDFVCTIEEYPGGG